VHEVDEAVLGRKVLVQGQETARGVRGPTGRQSRGQWRPPRPAPRPTAARSALPYLDRHNTRRTAHRGTPDGCRQRPARRLSHTTADHNHRGGALCAARSLRFFPRAAFSRSQIISSTFMQPFRPRGASDTRTPITLRNHVETRKGWSGRLGH
jgi:hypothetical protein